MSEGAREGGARPAVGWLRRLRANVAVQDPVVLTHHVYLLLLAVSASPSEAASRAVGMFALLAAATAATIVLVRAELLPPGWFRAALYSTVLVGSLPASYIGLASLFDALQPETLDTQLRALDEALLGTTPALWLTRFNRVAVNEWFSFFYQSFYGVLALGLLLPVLFDRGRRQQEAILGAGIVGMVGDTVYTLVPGAGPHATVAFPDPVHGGFWWSVVWSTVRAEGVLDVFPSVHTAMPVFFTLLAFRHRDRRLMRWLWPALGLVSAQIIVATMLLRWHWAIDIIAGLVLAVGARLLVARISRFEEQRRSGGGRQPVWEPIFRWQRDPIQS